MRELTQKIKKWIDTEATKNYPIIINEEKKIDKGHYYNFSTTKSRFCLIIRKLKETEKTKIHWIFHRTLTQDEKAYWSGRYEFKFDNDDIKYSRNTLHIGEIKNNEPIKFIMAREVSTLRTFIKDLKWILKMEERHE